MRRRHWSSLLAASDTTRVGVQGCPGPGELLASGALETGEAVHHHHLDPPTPVLVALGEPGLEGLLGTGPGPCPEARPDHCGRARGCRSMMTAGVLVAPLGAALHVLVDAEHLHTGEAVRVAGDGLFGPG